MWSRKSSAILASVAHIETKKFSLAQEHFKTLMPGSKANLQAVKFVLEYKCFPCEYLYIIATLDCQKYVILKVNTCFDI